jgi:hypothetical protein
VGEAAAEAVPDAELSALGIVRPIAVFTHEAMEAAAAAGPSR